MARRLLPRKKVRRTKTVSLNELELKFLLTFDKGSRPKSLTAAIRNLLFLNGYQEK